MLRAVLKSPVRIAALITAALLLVLAASEAIKWDPFSDQVDFKVYLTAAQLVREHRGVQIYDAADTGQNPQIRFAPANSAFQRAASEIGIPAVRLYVYPPTLADLLVPFTFLSLQHASDAWLALNILTIVGAAMLMTWLVYDTVFHIAWLGFFLGILCFRGNIWEFSEGQISSVLLLLWTSGIVFYAKGFKRTSAAAFALATAIKLTPLIVLLPFLIWREWKWTRWFALSLLLIGVILCLVNGPRTLLDYGLHVMPPMSAGFTSIGNISLPSGIQQLYLGVEGRNFLSGQATVPTSVELGAKLITSAVLLAALFCIYRLGPIRSNMGRAKILALMALLSLYCSPVAWRSAYGIVFLAAFFLWRDAFRSVTRIGLLLLAVCTLEFSFFFDTFFVRFAHGVLLSATSLLAPVSGCVLIFYTFRQMQLLQNTHSTNESLSNSLSKLPSETLQMNQRANRTIPR